MHRRAHIRYAGTDTDAAGRSPRLAPADDCRRAAQRLSRSPHKRRFGFVDERQAAGGRGGQSVEAIGGGAAVTSREAKPPATGDLAARPSHGALLPQRRSGARRRRSPRDDLTAPGRRIAGPAIIIEPHQTIVVEPGWRRAAPRRDHLDARPRQDADAGARRRSAPRPIRSLLEIFNNLFMCHRRADGRDAAEHRLLGEHQGAARFLLRGSSTPSGTLVANAPHMPVHLGSMDACGRDRDPTANAGDPARRRLSRSTRPITAARICPTSPSARRCSTRPTAGIRFSGSPAAAITPMSAASRPARCRRSRHHRGRRRLSSTTSSWSIVGTFRERDIRDAARPRRTIRRETRTRTSPTSRPQVAANEKGAAELKRRRSATSGWTWSTPIWATCRTTPRKACGASSDRFGRRRIQLRDPTRATIIKVSITVDKARREATVDFTGTSPQRPDNFNAPGPVDPRRGALCVPRHGRRRRSR